jgi:fucose permease
MKILTATVALLAVFTLAICFILIGAISEEMKARLGIDNSQVGSLASALFLTSLVVQLFVGPLVDKVGHKSLAVAGFVAAAGAIFLLAFAPNFNIALIACGLLGVGAMCANTVGNTLIPIVLFEGKEPARASNFGNGFVGLAFVLTPLALIYLIGNLKVTYQAALCSLGALVMLFAVLALFPSYPQVSTGYRFSQAVRLLGERPVLVAALALLCYIALEISMNTWIKPLMTEMSGGGQNPAAAKHATWVLSLFGLSMAIGRFATSTIKGLTAVGTKLIAGASLVTVGAIALLTMTHSYGLAVVAVIAVGLALAPIFPTIVGVTFSRYEPGLYGSIFGIMFAIGLLGPTIVPKIIGSLSVGASIQKSLPIAAVMALVLCALAVLMGKLAPRKQVTGARRDLEEEAAPGTTHRAGK